MSRTHQDDEEEKVLLQEGQQVDRYIVKDIVGRGGLAVVYRVEHTQLKSPFALKQLLITSPYIRRRLRQEGVVQANVRHANLVLVTDMIELPTGPGLIMEFVKGPTLEQLLAGGQQLAVEEVDRIAEGILAGVVAAHARGLIHRDLKPGNVLLQVDDGGYVPRITDFGFVKVVTGDDDLDLSVTQPGIKLGTPRYMAPEQATNARGVDAGADVYSLGAVLYELATGQKAFQHDRLEMEEMERDKLWDRFRPVQELRPDMPERWVRAIQGALRADRKARVDSASQLLALWHGEEVSLPAAAPPPVAVVEADTLAISATPAASPAGPDLRRGAVGFGVGMLLLAAVVIAWRAGTSSGEAPPAPAPVSAPAAAPAAVEAAAPVVVEPPAPAPPVAASPASAPVKAAPRRAAAPPPAAEPPPERPPAPAEEPEPTPVIEVADPAPAAPPPDHGTVRVEGDADGLFLQQGSARLLPGGVPAGTYKIVQVVSGAQPVSMGSVDVVAGEVTTVRCSARLKRCK